jgi:hypothetical protein
MMPLYRSDDYARLFFEKAMDEGNANSIMLEVCHAAPQKRGTTRNLPATCNLPATRNRPVFMREVAGF